MTSLLEVASLSKSFPGLPRPVVDAVSFTAEAGQILVLVGPSGCGKTTTLRLLAGFETPDQGTIRFADRLVAGEGTRVPPERRGMGFVFQDYALFPHLTVRQNVMFGLRKYPVAERQALAERTLDVLGLEGIGGRRPHDLSGGQQQRVALARALAPEPRLLLLDEPFSNLDADLRRGMRQHLRELVRTFGMGVVLVTHDQEEALSVGDAIAIMRDGRIEQVGAPEAVYGAPSTAWVAQFLGGTNLFRAEAAGTRAESVLGSLDLRESATGPVWVSLRPEHLALEPAGGSLLTGTVIAREFLGHDLHLRVAVGDTQFVSQMSTDTPWQPGDQVGLRPIGPAVVIQAPEVATPAAPNAVQS